MNAITVGQQLARQMFHKRGNHSEIHLSELELAAGLALAAQRAEGPGLATVWVVVLEWNQPPAEATGDPGLVGVYHSKESADRAADAERKRFDAQGQFVYPSGKCMVCGEYVNPSMPVSR